MDLAAARRILGIPSTATWREARLAWRRLAQTHHPDRGGDAARFKEIRSAWEVLDAEMTAPGPTVGERKGTPTSPTPETATPAGPRIDFGTPLGLREMRVDGRRVGTAASACIIQSIGLDRTEALLQVNLVAPTPNLGGWFDATIVVGDYVASVRGPIVSTSHGRVIRGRGGGVVSFWVRPILGAR
jgi:hypothetical protein